MLSVKHLPIALAAFTLFSCQPKQKKLWLPNHLMLKVPSGMILIF